jgi:chemotaxis signal transduction protein
MAEYKMKVNKLLLFRSSRKIMGIDAALVKEVHRDKMPFAKMDGSSRQSAKIGDSREIIFCDLSQLMRESSATVLAKQKTIVIELADRLLGIIVDDVYHIIKADQDAIQPLPAVLGRRAQQFFPQVMRAKNRLILVLDPEPLLSLPGQEDQVDDIEKEKARGPVLKIGNRHADQKRRHESDLWDHFLDGLEVDAKEREKPADVPGSEQVILAGESGEVADQAGVFEGRSYDDAVFPISSRKISALLDDADFKILFGELRSGAINLENLEVVLIEHMLGQKTQDRLEQAVHQIVKTDGGASKKIRHILAHSLEKALSAGITRISEIIRK